MGMSDRQSILDGLVGEKSRFNIELVDAQTEFDRLKKRIIELEQLISALDVVIKGLNGDTELQFSKTTSESERNENQAQIENSKDSDFQLQPKKEPQSLRGTGRDHFAELPQEFDKNDVAELILKYHTELDAVNENSLRNVVKQFVDLGWARIKVHSTGKTPQIYEKI